MALPGYLSLPAPFSSGITAPAATCWACSWAWRADLAQMAIKHVNAMCPEHGGVPR